MYKQSKSCEKRTVNLKMCCGCEACVNVCPRNAIRMSQDRKGFYIADIDKDHCIKCGKCTTVCPLIHVNKFPQSEIVYAAIHKNPRVVEKSSSGGVFFQLATAILNQNGTVFGVEYNSEFNAIHSMIGRISEIEKFMGSKYVQSRNDVFSDIAKLLMAGKIVLYSGTPCQVAAVKNFTADIREGSLYTVEVLCHGIGSPRLFHEHIASFRPHVAKMNFRDKSRSIPTISYDLGRCIKKIDFNLDHYGNGFNRCLLLNDVCFKCPYAGGGRAGDLSIGDFWKGPTTESIVGKKNSTVYPKGVSLVIINSTNGLKLWSLIQSELHYQKSNFECAAKGNRTLSRPNQTNMMYEWFWKIYLRFGFRVASNIFCASILYRLKYYIKKNLFRHT